MVSRDAGGGYHIGRLSYYDTPEGKGWDRSTLDKTHPTREHPAEFQGETIGVRDGLVKCLYCHVTNPRTGHDSIGPEMADRAIGCERCHGPGGNHILALQAGFPDLAIVNPAAASPQAVTRKQCNDCHILQTSSVTTSRKTQAGSARRESAGPAAAAIQKAAARSAALPATIPTKVPGLQAPQTTRSNASRATRPVQPAGNDTPGSTDACRPGSSFRTCPVNASKGCIQCHMPRVRIDLLHTDLTDHYIRVHRKER